MQGAAAEPGPATDDAARVQALEWADAARVTRQQVREMLSSGTTTLGEVFARAHEDPLVGQVKLLWALESVPGARKVDTRRALGALGIAEGTRLETLDQITTDRLGAAFDLGAGEPPAASAQDAR